MVDMTEVRVAQHHLNLPDLQPCPPSHSSDFNEGEREGEGQRGRESGEGGGIEREREKKT